MNKVCTILNRVRVPALTDLPGRPGSSAWIMCGSLEVPDSIVMDNSTITKLEPFVRTSISRFLYG